MSDTWQRRGLGHQLLGRLVDVARKEGFGSVWAEILAANLRMQRVCARHGFAISDEKDGIVRAELNLQSLGRLRRS